MPTGGVTGGALKIPAETVPMVAITPTSRRAITVAFFMFFTSLRARGISKSHKAKKILGLRVMSPRYH
jgi:hypothetical protein